jgi:prolyl-tRNA editing enzyme YbaK/EbsC (Cys-tRNA(Pro) deacylase)
VSERLLGWLREAGVAFEVLEHPPARISAEASRVVRAEDRFVHCVLPAHLRADNAASRTIVGTPALRFAAPEELAALTGCAPGAVVRMAAATVCRFAIREAGP